MIVRETSDANIITKFQNKFGFDWGGFDRRNLYFCVLEYGQPIGLMAFESGGDKWAFHAYHTKKCRGRKALYSGLLAVDMVATITGLPVLGFPDNRSHNHMYLLANFKKHNDHYIYEA